MKCPRPSISRVVFWEPVVSPHKADLIRQFARSVPGWEVVTVADQPLSPERISLGWTVEVDANYSPLVSPSSESIAELVARDPEETLHIFSGIRWVPTLVKAIRAVRAARARFAIMSEPREIEGWKGRMRIAHSWLTEGWFRRNCEFILAIGRNGPPWFQRVGYPADKVFPFAYFIRVDADAPHGERVMSGCLRVGFVGRLVREKGVFDLVQACARLGVPYELELVGIGSDEDLLRSDCRTLGVHARFVGAVPMDAIQGRLRDVDVLVLASHSKSDGWGVAISEALLAGCAVVATEEVGASILLRSPRLGRIVPRCQPQAIAAAIEAIGRDASNSDAREARARYGREVLSGAAGARHLLDVIAWSEGRGARPRPFYEAERGAP